MLAFCTECAAISDSTIPSAVTHCRKNCGLTWTIRSITVIKGKELSSMAQYVKYKRIWSKVFVPILVFHGCLISLVFWCWRFEPSVIGCQYVPGNERFLQRPNYAQGPLTGDWRVDHSPQTSWWHQQAWPDQQSGCAWTVAWRKSEWRQQAADSVGLALTGTHCSHCDECCQQSRMLTFSTLPHTCMQTKD